MFKIKNYLNFILLTITVLLVIYFDSFKIISSELNSILPNGNQKELLKEFSKTSSSKKIYLAVEGLNQESLNRIKTLEKQLLEISGIEKIQATENKYLEKHKKEYTYFIKDINQNRIEKEINIKKELEKIKHDILSASFSYKVNKEDPLNIFLKESKNNSITFKNNYLTLRDYGYLTIFTLNSSVNNIEEYKRVYNSIFKIVNKEEKIFSPIFYYVENSQIMKDDVNKIILISTVMLILLYIVLLKNLKLLVNSLTTITSSILFALFLCSLFIDTISIFVLVFGISISTVAIDYMFHNYMNGYYIKKKKINSSVFFGMITTVGTFFILSFIDFDLIKHICYFTIFSLIFSYLQFTFVYPIVTFKSDKHININFGYKKFLRPELIVIISIILIFINIDNTRFNLNIKDLDVNNTKLKKLEEFFNKNLNNEKKLGVIIKANSIDELITKSNEIKDLYKNSHIPLSTLISSKKFEDKKTIFKQISLMRIKQDLEEQALNIGFKKDYFADTYNFNTLKPQYTLEYIKNLGIEVIKIDEFFITFAYLPLSKQNEYLKHPYIESLSIKDLFKKNLQNVIHDLINFGIFSMLFILAILILIRQKRFFISLSFLLFPFSCILIYSLFSSFNILNIFMIFIVLAISIDYGIYISSKKIDSNTYKAILYSILSTFAGFGVLVFSKINALFSIGIICIIGILSILFLLLTLKGNK